MAGSITCGGRYGSHEILCSDAGMKSSGISIGSMDAAPWSNRPPKRSPTLNNPANSSEDWQTPALLLRELLGFLQMLPDDGQHLCRKCLHRGVVAFVGIFREQFLRLLMGAHLLLGIGLVEILLMRRVQIVDHALMLVIWLGWKVDLDLLLLYDAFQLLGGLRVSLDHMLAELLHGIRLPLLGGDLAGLDLVLSLIAVVCTKSGVLGAPHEASAMVARTASAASRRVRIRNAPISGVNLGNDARQSHGNPPRFPAPQNYKLVNQFNVRPDRPCGSPRRGTTRAVQPDRSTLRSSSSSPRRSPRRRDRVP